MKKIVVILMLLLVVIGIAGGVFYANRNSFVENKLSDGFENVTGLKTEVIGVQTENNGSKISVQRINILNPEGYYNREMAVIRDLLMICDPVKYLMNKKLICSRVDAFLEEVAVERTVDGKVNIREIKAISRETLENTDKKKKDTFLIERLNMNYGVIKLMESTASGTRNETIEIGKRPEIYGFMNDPGSIAYIPVVRILQALKRGSLGIPRATIQQRIVDTTGKR